MTTSAPFVSPLAVTQPSRWTAIDFGRVSRTPPTEALADTLEAEIWRIAGRLPPTLADDAARVLRGYPGPGRRFIDLFYQPVWSVLHWLAPDPDSRQAAVRVHALALMLHLWDDHLCDAQLPTDIMRLQFRSIAWQEMMAALADDASSAELADTYLESVHARAPAASLDDHLARFERQIALWHAAPRMLAARRGHRVAASVASALSAFCAAWRMIDDIQDIDDDSVSGQDNCARLALTDARPAGWDIAWTTTSPHMRHPQHDAALSDAVDTVLNRARDALQRAQADAHDAGLHGWAAELAQAQGF